jgi:hypothetical protein
MFQITRDFEPEYAGPRDVQRTRALNPALKDFRTWLAENKSRIPLG